MKPIRTERVYAIRGIPEDLPAGERVLWQGRPAWLDLAVTAFHLRQVAVYFAALLAIRMAYLMVEGASVFGAVRGSLPLIICSITGLTLLAILALWSSRTTIYAITTRRVVMRVGMALPIDINLPYTGIESASLAVRKNGHGDLPLLLHGKVHLAYAHLWPYARPWRLAHPEPMLRAVPEAAKIAQTLAQALATSGGVAIAPSVASAPAAPAGSMPQASPAGGLAGYGAAAAIAASQ